MTHQRSATRSTTAAGAAALLVFVAGSAHGQVDTVQQHTEKNAQEAPSDDATSLAAALGGTLNTGNTRTWQVTLGSDLLIVRDPHALTAMLAFAYGKADIPGDATGYEPTVKNLRTRARYDYFLTRMDALFAAGAFRWDEFAGLDSRVQGQLGYLRYLLRTDVHRFWGEVGYDITHDDYSPLPNPAFMIDPDTGDPVDPSIPPLTPDGTEVVHSARLFLGYDNRLTEALTYLGGLEGLINVEEPKDTRINMDNAVRSKIAGNLQLELKFSLLFDNVPVPGAKKLDTQTIGSVIYNLI